jgi:NADPH2:quinone reductase
MDGPKTMRALVCDGPGEPGELIVRDVPVPAPKAGEVLVAAEASGLGYADALMVRGAYQVRRNGSFIVGAELVGRVVALGAEADPALLGQRVIAFTHHGSVAEIVRVEAARCFVLPDAIPAGIGLMLNASATTAFFALDDCGALRPGERVLVLGAGGGVGSVAVSIAKAMGAVVAAAAGSPEKLALARACGADLLVDYGAADWRARLKEAGMPAVDVVFDTVGGSWSETAFRCLAPGGRHLVVGFASGEIPRLPLNLPLLKRASLVGVDFGGHIAVHGDTAGRLLGKALAFYQSGQLPMPAPAVHGIDAAPALMQAMLERRQVGKVVIGFDASALERAA